MGGSVTFIPDDITHEAKVENLLEEQNKLLTAVVILLCEQQDQDPKKIILDAEQQL